jgi:hypothetical protein
MKALRGCYEGVTRVLRGSYESVTKVLQGLLCRVTIKERTDLFDELIVLLPLTPQRRDGDGPHLVRERRSWC